jgi:hypothetical protein
MPTPMIGTLKEGSLHAEIKNWYREAEDLLETKLGGYLIDIIRGNQLIEIQTGHFYKLKDKLNTLLPDHSVRLVYPIPLCKWISRYDGGDAFMSGRRKSPKHGQIQTLFDELVYLPEQFMHPNFSLEVLLIEQEDSWINDGKGSWRRKHWSILDRKLLAVYEQKVFYRPEDYRMLLPDGLPTLFSSREIANQIMISQRLASKMLFCLSAMNIIKLCEVVRRRRYFCLIRGE